jgi:DNA-directed RNA polymerase subunit L
MEIEVVDSKKNYMEFYLVGETHTFCNVLRSVLSEDDSVKRVAYAVEHPVTHRMRPLFELETRGSTRPTTALRRAAKKLAKTCDELRDGFQTALG